MIPIPLLLIPKKVYWYMWNGTFTRLGSMIYITIAKGNFFRLYRNGIIHLCARNDNSTYLCPAIETVAADNVTGVCLPHFLSYKPIGQLTESQ